jgi:tRNA A-37 threonylcarbamoyl transferase component Bud32/tetratricopeptide (TPR) repeat protein
VLGQGATATVHLALDQRTGERVAIKMLRPELAASGAAERFLKEIAHTESLKHQGILRVLDSGQHEGQMYFTLPYMEGGTLRQKLKTERQLSLDDAVKIVATIAEALDYAHAKGLVHRDVKPENILFTGGRACLGDFGIARALQTVYGDGTTSSATIRGTPAYMSPEQAAGAEKLDGRSDVFSLACVAYEMVTGMQAFMGPTPESVVAQRFAFTPREIRAYRPAAPTSIDTALARAFTLSPADRYPTAGELARALEVARNTTATAAPAILPAPAPLSARARWAIATAATVVVAGVLLATDTAGSRALIGWVPKVDTTRVAILPFEDAGASLAAEDLLSERLRRYRGIAVVETFATADAVRQRGAISSLADARAIALALGAGRYIRGRVIDSGADRALYAAMYSSATNSELYHARVQLPTDSTLLMAAFAALADSLVLRGAREGAPVGARVASLPGTQAFVRGRAALSEWDLARADSLFSLAVTLDSANGRSHLWLAQVRSWIGVTPGSWRSNAERAAEDSSNLSADERRLAAALRALAFDEFARACATYRDITRERPRDFAGWYGLGECHRADRTVVADQRSPSGWRFRSSYYQAMLAYQRAFEVFPSSYRAFQENAFQSLHQLLFTNPSRLRQGFGTGTPQQVFFSKPAASGDTVLFVPYPREQVLGGASIVDSASLRRASERARRVFHRVTSAWSSALPGSPGTKEAMAISLEVMGDLEAAIDTVRAGRRLAVDSSQQIRLAVHEVMLAVKVGLTKSGATLQRAASLADSALARRPRNVADAEQLTRLAVLLGRCRIASALAQSAATPTEGLPPSFVTAVYRQLPGIALGCAPASTLPHLSARAASTLSDPSLVLAEYGLIGGMAGIGYPENPALIERLARATSDFVLVVEDSLMKGNTSAARRVLRDQRMARPSEAPPEAAFAEARLWLTLGDTVAAVQMLDSCVDAASTTATLLPVGNLLANTVRIASLSRALMLRADLAVARGAPAGRWARAVADLWSGADSELQPAVRRMKELSSR